MKGGYIGESGTDDIMKLLVWIGLYDQFPTEFILLTLAIKVSFLEVRAK